MDELPLEPGEEVLGTERCASAARTVAFVRGCAGALVVTAIVLLAALVAGGQAQLVLFAVAGVSFVATIPLAWFAFLRWLEEPSLRAVTSRRALEVTRTGDVRDLPLARVTGVRARTASGLTPACEPDDFVGATGLELESSDGRRFTLESARAPEIGPAVLRAMAAAR